MISKNKQKTTKNNNNKPQIDWEGAAFISWYVEDLKQG